MSTTLRFRAGMLLSALLVTGLLIGAVPGTPNADAEDAPAAKAAAGPQLFDTAEEAAKALVEAAAANDDAALKKLAGPEHADGVQDGGDPSVLKERAQFATLAKTKAGLQENADGSMTLVVGDDDWPLPIPFAKKGEKWFVDFAAGREEMTARRIGHNELRAIAICHAYSDAQVQYAGKDRDGDGVREYAQLLRSSEGKMDGLYWAAAEGEESSPFGPMVESWREAGVDLNPQRKVPVGGYYWRVLKGQGTAAPGGRHSYIINGNQIAGFAVIGYPAKYMETGVMSFMVSHHGVVYERDLGANGECVVRNLKGFNPSKGWTVVKD